MEAYSCFPLFLIFTILQRVIQLTRYDSPRPPIQKRPRLSLASPRNVLAWYRNINLFPFPGLTVRSPVKVDLPWPDGRWPGTLAPSVDRIPTGHTMLLLPGFALLPGPQDFTALLRPKQYAPLPDHPVWGAPGYRQPIQPRPFSPRKDSESELLRFP